MKIGISCYPTWGGSGVVATELAMALAEGGDEVHVISYAMPSRLSFTNEHLYFHEVVVPRYPLFDYPPYSLALATQIVQVARDHDLQLLHVHYAVPNAVSAVLARDILAPQPLKVVTTLHGTDITLVGNDPNYLETTRYGIQRSDAVTAVSDWLRRATIEQFGIQDDIRVVPNFVDAERCSRGIEGPGARRWAAPGERVLVHVSNFRPVKRVMDVVSIFERVREREPVRLLLVGDGPERPRVERYCRGSGICDAITFVGNVGTVEEVLAGADLFLLPSESESFGLAALEAMACEVPVIASDTGGLPEVLLDGEHGFLRPVGDVEGMAQAALELLGDEERRGAFARAARLHAVERFGQQKIVAIYRQLYEDVLAE